MPYCIVVQDDIEVFRSVSEAERALEPADIVDYRVTVIDQTGQLWRPAVVKSGLSEVVSLEQDEQKPDPDQAEELLRKFFARVEAGNAAEKESLDALWARVERHCSR